MRLYGVFEDGKYIGVPYFDTCKEVCQIWARFLASFSFSSGKTFTVRQIDNQA